MYMTFSTKRVKITENVSFIAIFSVTLYPKLLN